jgi:hypothetical protein
MEWQVCLVLSNACPAVLVSLWPEKEQRSASRVQKATFQSSMDLFFACPAQLEHSHQRKVLTFVHPARGKRFFFAYCECILCSCISFIFYTGARTRRGFKGHHPVFCAALANMHQQLVCQHVQTVLLDGLLRSMGPPASGTAHLGSNLKVMHKHTHTQAPR